MPSTDIYQMPNGTIYGLDSFVSWTTQIEPLLFPVLLLVIWVIIFVAAKSYSSSRAWTYASFITFILSLPVTILGWSSPNYTYLCLVLLGIGLAWIRIGDSAY